MKRFLLLLSVLVLLPVLASAYTAVPAGVTVIEAEAFANTDIDGLVIPSSVKTVGANVLAGCNASYLYLEGASTVLASGANNGVPFVFAPQKSSASSLSGFYPTENLVSQDGLYYYVADTAMPLCGKAPFSLSGTLTIPKLVSGKPVTSLSALNLSNTGVTKLSIPEYLPLPSGVSAEHRQTIFLTSPAASVTTTPAGRYVTWTATIDGDYGDVAFEWTFTIAGETISTITSEPTVKYAPMKEGTCTVSVKAVDEVGDTVSATGDSVTVTAAQPVYRALLIGNTYPNTSNALKGPSTDVAAMKTILSSMTGTKYTWTTSINRTASGIKAAIASTFSGAQPADISLFYYSGHGTDTGALVGTDGNNVSVTELRNALQKIPGVKIVLLDSCYSGASINRSVPSPSAFNQAVVRAFSSAKRSATDLEDAGYIVLTSCSLTQTSLSLSGDGSHFWGVFTYGLCYGSGYDEWKKASLGRLPADSNGDGAITLGEAYRGVQERVSYLRTQTEVDQETQYYGDTSFVLWRK